MPHTAVAEPPAPAAKLRTSPRSTYVAMYAFVALLHVVGWGTLVLFVVPQNFHVGGQVFGIGLGLTAYTLGMRHAFDADHIAAIDNTTRKLREDRGTQPVSVGFWFSLGHSSVVVLMVVLLTFGLRALGAAIQNPDSFVERYAGVFGASVSGVFLLLIGGINLVILLHIVRVFNRMRHGQFDEAALEDHLSNRGAMNRLFRGAMRSVRRPFHIYPIGVLFGFGFDTVSEITLLALAGSSATVAGLPWYATLTLPILFAAGMSVLDTTDGAFMNGAYGWAFARPVRKVFYNMTVTALSVIVAIVIGLVELVGVIATQLGAHSGVLGWVAGLSLNSVGFGIVALFVAVWLVALAAWKLGHVEERWTSRLAASADD
ncbi:MAG: HoxN/HupN/NixA family nickel/cobalt transporter [Nocardioidaceae bacterium]